MMNNQVSDNPFDNRFFVRGEAICRIDHAQPFSPEDIYGALQGWWEQGGEGHEGDEWIAQALQSLNVARIVTIPLGAAENPPSDCGTLDVGVFPNYLTYVFLAIPPSGDSQDADALHADDAALLQGVIALGSRIAERRPSVEIYATEDYFVPQAVSFNWYNTSAPGQAIGTGGPGTMPVVAGSSVTPTPENEVGVPLSRGASSPSTVDVYILDTLPDSAYLSGLLGGGAPPDRPFIRWLTDKIGAAPTPAALAALAGTGEFELIANDAPGVNAPRLIDELNDQAIGSEIARHRYDLTAHGLFVADLVCSVAQAVPTRLHLIEVLNRWGVGALDTIVDGLLKVLDRAQQASEPLVVNCSFTMTMPRYLNGQAAEHGIAQHPFVTVQRGIPAALVQSLNAFMEEAEFARQMQDVLQPLFNALYCYGASIVAAAGNERAGQNGLRPPARYPAAFPSVVGVGAVNQRAPVDVADIASYSNWSDEPTSDGLATYGGEADLAPGLSAAVANTGNSLLGLYVGPDPTAAAAAPPAGYSYLAHWAGTSFAAPVIAGSLAILRANGDSRDDALTNLRAQGHPLNGGAPGELVIDVT